MTFIGVTNLHDTLSAAALEDAEVIAGKTISFLLW